MRQFLTLTAVAVLVVVATADEPKKDAKMKKHELKVTFATPTPGYTATVSEVRQVGQELWAKVDVTAPDGVAADVLSMTTAEVTFEGPDLPVKYAVFGKTWKWANKEKDITFADDIGKEDKAKWEKAWKDGKVVYTPKKK